jgi:large subunit ribosomal protein L1
MAIRLGVDPRKADQMVRGTVALPSGTGKDVRVAVFATGPAAEEARAAGADVVGADDLAAEIEAGKLDFDLAIATPDMMPLVGRLGRVLGPRGLMPNPKTGTVTTDVGRAVGEFKGGKVEYRTDRYGNVHVQLGKVSFDDAALEANFRAVLDELQRAKPASVEGPLPPQDHGVVDDGTGRAHRHRSPQARDGLSPACGWADAPIASAPQVPQDCSPKTAGPPVREENEFPLASRGARSESPDAGITPVPDPLLVVVATVRQCEPRVEAKGGVHRT